MNSSAALEWNTTWTAGSWFGLEEEPKYKKIAKTMAYCILFLVSLIGNILIIWAIHRDKRLRTNTNILIANMALSDLLVPVFSIPSDVVEIIFDGKWLIDGNFGLALCKLVPYLRDTSWTISIYSCVFIALDRYYAVAHPFKGGFSRSKLKYILSGIWIFSGVICIPYLSSYSLLKQNFPSVCMFTKCVRDWNLFGMPLSIAKGFQMYLNFAAISGLPFPVTLALYILIVLRLRQQNNLPGQSLNSARARRDKQNKKVLKMSVVIVTLTFMSWIFIHCYLFLWYYGKLSNLSASTDNDLFFAAFFIAQMTCSYNFFIYLKFNAIYRRNFKAILSPFLSLFHGRNEASSIAEQQATGHRSCTNSNIDLLKHKRRDGSSGTLEMHNLPLPN